MANVPDSMAVRLLQICVYALACFAGGTAPASEANGTSPGVLGAFPFVRNNPCTKPYRQVAVSPPLQGTSDGGKGFPWRATYGTCAAQFDRWSIHHDWVVSYLDAAPQGEAQGGNGIALGTDVNLQWQPRQGTSNTPYFELGGGLQYAAGTPFPARGSRWMFTINAGIGVLLHATSRSQLNTAIRYLHISNAGLWRDNAGYDALHLLIGLRW